MIRLTPPWESLPEGHFKDWRHFVYYTCKCNKNTVSLQKNITANQTPADEQISRINTRLVLCSGLMMMKDVNVPATTRAQNSECEQ